MPPYATVRSTLTFAKNTFILVYKQSESMTGSPDSEAPITELIVSAYIARTSESVYPMLVFLFHIQHDQFLAELTF